MSQDGSASAPEPHPAGAVRRLRAVVSGCDRASRWVIVIAMAAMAGLVSAQVFQRYVLSSSIDAADELSRLFFVWAIFLAIPHGIRHGVHVGIDVVITRLPPRVQSGLHRTSSVAALALMTVVLWASVVAVIDKWGELMPTLPVTAALYYIPVCICAAHSIGHFLLVAVGGPRIWGAQAGPEVLA